MMLIHQPIFLTGFMGAGKTTVGQHLATRLGCPFADLDALIEERIGKSINMIFAEEGETYFRKQESAILTSITASHIGVYATGGGIVMSKKNREIMQSAGYVVYLRSRWATLQERLMGSTQRPLLNTKDGLSNAHNLLLRRTPYYEEAELIVDTDGKTADAVVDEIVNLLGVKE